MNKSTLLYMLCLFMSWTVDLVHWEEWNILDEKFALEVKEAVPRKPRVCVSIPGRCAEAVISIAKRLLSRITRIMCK